MIDLLKKITLRSFYFLFSLTMLYLTNIALFKSSQYFISMQDNLLVFLSIFVMAIFLLLFFISRKLNDKKIFLTIIVVSLMLIGIIQLLFSVIFINYPTWDFGHVFEAAYGVSQGEVMLPEYFYLDFPNNIGATLILGNIFKVVNVFTSQKNVMIIVGILLNISIIQLSLIMILTLLTRMKNIKWAAILAVVFIFVSPLYAYAPIFYTDTLAMIFPIIAVLLIFAFDKSDKKSKWFYLLGAGLSLAVGTIIKTNVIIVGVALIIYLIYKYSSKNAILAILIVIVPFGVTSQLYQFEAQKHIPIPYEEAGLPATHWIMMGLYGRGWFSPEEVTFSQNIYRSQGKEATQEANVEVIKQRIEEYGFKGLVDFWDNKITETWNDGTYFSPEKLQRNLIYDFDVQKYIVGSEKEAFVYMSQVMHIIMLIGLFLYSSVFFKEKIRVNTLILVAIFGVFLFLIIWETRSRYLVFMLPLMWLVSIQGWGSFYELITTTYDKYKSKKLVKKQTTNK